MDTVLAGTDGSERMEVDRAGPPDPGRLRTARPSRRPAPPSASPSTATSSGWPSSGWPRPSPASGAVGGTVVVMDPRTGEVLALATEPTVDADRPGEGTDAARGNPAITDVYEPGSVNKIITVAAALEAGVATPDTPFDGAEPLRGRPARPSATPRTTGPSSSRSPACWPPAATSARSRPTRSWATTGCYSALRAFGFGRPTGIGLPGESAGLLPDVCAAGRAPPGPTISFGQGLSVTPVQVASVFSTIANDGVRVAPRIVAAVAAPDGAVERPGPRRPGGQRRAPPSRSGTMLEAATSDEGTAPLAARIDGYRVAGKTGHLAAGRPGPAAATAATPPRSSGWPPPTTRAWWSP